MIGRKVAWFFSTSRDLIARRLIKWRVTPNMLTVAGGVFTALTGVMLAAAVATGQAFFYAFAVLMLYWTAACDMLDGAVARIGGKGSTFGGFLDSTVDRVSDFILWVALAIGFLLQPTPNFTFAILCIVAMFDGLMISYTKARAEDFIDKCSVGFWQRGERFAAILFATLAANPGALVVQQAISPAFTAWRRVKFTYDSLNGKTPVSDPRVNGKWYHKIQWWMYPRMSWQYDIAVLANIAWLLFMPINPAKWNILGYWTHPRFPVLVQEVPQPVISRKVITVSSARELLEKIESNSIIELAPGKYDLTDMYSGKEKYTKHVSIASSRNPGDELTLHDLHNVKIRGLGKKPVSMTTAFAGVNVLIFSHCSGVELSNLSIGHDSPRGTCDGGVVMIRNCDNMLIGDCDLYGCGIEGLRVFDSHMINICNTTIRDCSHSILRLSNCQNVNFFNVKMKNNKGISYFIAINNSRPVVFSGCEIEGNQAVNTVPLFSVSGDSDVSVTGYNIRANKAACLEKPKGAIKFIAGSMDSNIFTDAKKPSTSPKPDKSDPNTVVIPPPTSR